MSDRKDAARVNAAAPATLLGLRMALANRLDGLCYGMPLFPTKTEGSARAPVVINGWLPRKKNTGATDDDEFPFLIVRPRSGVDTSESADQEATASIDIVIGTYSDDDDGIDDIFMLIDAIREDLGAAPEIAGTAFRHIGPLSWAIPEDQPRPQWFGVVTTIWQLPRTRRVEELNPTEA